MRSDPSDHPYSKCSCGRNMELGQYVCKRCQGGFGRFELIAPPRFRPQTIGLGVGPEHAGMVLCDYCPPAQFRECRECVKAGAPVGCEWLATGDGVSIRLQLSTSADESIQAPELVGLVS